MGSTRLVGHLSLALAGAWLAGCEPAPLAPPDPNEGRTFSGAVTSAGGGTVATEGETLTVTIPAGALDADTTVTVGVVRAADGSATSVYELGPDGTEFQLPVTIALRFDAEPEENGRVVLAWLDGGAWRAIPGSRLVDGRIVGATRHFSRFAGLVVEGDEVSYPWPDGQGDEEAMTYWTWTDPTTDLAWQMPSAVRVMSWQEALDYCSNLYLDGGGWRLPSIDELRSLVRDCPLTETGGACAVTSECDETFACWGDVCNGCADGGCNWDPALFYEGEGSCVLSYWSSTTQRIVDPDTGEPLLPEDGLSAWTLSYAGARLGHTEKTAMSEVRVRCVR